MNLENFSYKGSLFERYSSWETLGKGLCECNLQSTGWVMGPGKANSPLSGESPLPGPHQVRLCCSLLKYDGDGGPVVIHSVLSEGLESAREQRLT